MRRGVAGRRRWSARRGLASRVAAGGGRPRRGPSVGQRWRELGHLLSNDAHLLAIVLVARQAPHFVADCRADSAACSGLAERGAYRFGVCHAAGANHVKRGSRGLVEANVKRTRHEISVARIMLRVPLPRRMTMTARRARALRPMSFGAPAS